MKYKHYKGNIYTMIGIAAAIESFGDEDDHYTDVVVYKNEKDQIFTRPVPEFFGMVENSDGDRVRRFEIEL